MKPVRKIAIGLTAIIFFIACKKNQPASDPNQPTSIDQVKTLLVGDWIEDSLNIEYTWTLTFIAPSYLHVDSSLNYRMVQTSANPLNNGNDTGQFTNIAIRYITPNSFYGNDDYFGNFGRMQINVLTEHQLVLYCYQMMIDPATFYFHK